MGLFTALSILVIGGLVAAAFLKAAKGIALDAGKNLDIRYAMGEMDASDYVEAKRMLEPAAVRVQPIRANRLVTVNP
ncbi:MAG: hypothetical protein A2Z99_09745 [Treponema sp. GWB1_62_6]|nr:MAG: hypothetical protein A2Z99_09745 [Treponema sp. GWB1_62_6]OHE62849.1 MAG: hypothetical protein A2Y36_15355 [Treponema sp. GWA1_62_8]OHE66013.1 MAG: hypothetical protein A2001_15600 [Treponema sp. GWC1_61_84]OHE73425.1 MAG: hypothetical protein A2413_03575 [Treponema sp. RIFOXYC1_FULL_61_9]HCM25090.1 hypothetical protein [Treponema sp.]